MFEICRIWLNTIIVVGIIFTIIRMITPNSSMKKYIFSLIGIVTVTIILSPIINIIASEDIEYKLSNSIQNIIAVETMANGNYDEYKEIETNNVRENFKIKIENDIRKKLKDKLNQEYEVNVSITNAYNIEKVYITLTSATSYDIASFLSLEYDVLKENIIIRKGG